MDFLDLLLASYDVRYVPVHSQVLIVPLKEAEGTEWSSFSGVLWGCQWHSRGMWSLRSMLTRNTIVIGNVCLLILFFIRKMASVGTESSRCLWARIGHRLLKFLHTEGKSKAGESELRSCYEVRVWWGVQIKQVSRARCCTEIQILQVFYQLKAKKVYGPEDLWAGENLTGFSCLT